MDAGAMFAQKDLNSARWWPYLQQLGCFPAEPECKAQIQRSKVLVKRIVDLRGGRTEDDLAQTSAIASHSRTKAYQLLVDAVSCGCLYILVFTEGVEVVYCHERQAPSDDVHGLRQEGPR